MTRFQTVIERSVFAEIDLQALSESSGIPLERLIDISEGADPSIFELGEIAEATGESPAYLIRPRPAVVARRDSQVDHAPMGEMLEIFDRHVAAFRKELGQTRPKSFPVSSPWMARVAGEKWAALHNLSWPGHDAPDPLFDVVEQELRIPVLTYPVAGAPFGATLLLNDTVAIWINSFDVPATHQRFTLAHELGHIMLQRLEMSRVETATSPEKAPAFGSAEQRAYENQANSFAGGVLYDRDRVLQHWDGERSAAGVARVAVGLGISYEAAIVAMKVHLTEEAPNVEAFARTVNPAKAFRAIRGQEYVNWYDRQRNREGLPQNLERIDLLAQALRRNATAG